MDLEKLKQELKDKVAWSLENPPVIGGQQCGVKSSKITLESEDLSLKITVGYHKNNLANKKLAFKLFEFALDELVK